MKYNFFFLKIIATSSKDLELFSESKEKFLLKKGPKNRYPVQTDTPRIPDVKVIVKRTNLFQATTEGASLKYCKSLLQLNNVTKNMSTKFQCMNGNLNERAIRSSVENVPILSFNVIDIS